MSESFKRSIACNPIRLKLVSSGSGLLLDQSDEVTDMSGSGKFLSIWIRPISLAVVGLGLYLLLTGLFEYGPHIAHSFSWNAAQIIIGLALVLGPVLYWCASWGKRNSKKLKNLSRRH